MYINAAKHKRKVANKTIGQQHQQNKLVERNSSLKLIKINVIYLNS